MCPHTLNIYHALVCFLGADQEECGLEERDYKRNRQVQAGMLYTSPHDFASH